MLIHHLVYTEEWSDAESEKGDKFFQHDVSPIAGVTRGCKISALIGDVLMRSMFIAILAILSLASPASAQQKQPSDGLYRPPAPAQPIPGMTYQKCFDKSTKDGYTSAEASKHCSSRYPR